MVPGPLRTLPCGLNSLTRGLKFNFLLDVLVINRRLSKPQTGYHKGVITMSLARNSIGASLLLFCGLFSAPGYAGLVLGAPPRESVTQADAIYVPIANFLTRITGQKVTYRYVDNWLSYQSDILNGAYDIVFDGPAFIGWRMAKYGWTPLVKLQGNLRFVVIVAKNNKTVNDLKDLEGYPLCGFAPPNLATLTIQFEFTNPARQPNLIAVRTFANAYRGVVSGRCVAGIMQAKLYQHINAKHHAARVIYRSQSLPNQAFSAGPRVPPAMRAQIATALLSAQGNAATSKLRAEFKSGQFVPATAQEYAGLGKLLKNVWGFNLRAASNN